MILRCERPKRRGPSESSTNVRISGDVNNVVVIEKRSVSNRVVKRKSCQSKQQTENQPALLWDLKNQRLSPVPVILLLLRIHGFHFRLPLAVNHDHLVRQQLPYGRDIVIEVASHARGMGLSFTGRVWLSTDFKGLRQK